MKWLLLLIPEILEALCKSYGKAMLRVGWQSKIRSKGYHLCQVTASNLEHNKIVPLYFKAYSSAEEGYVSSTAEVKKVISKVIEKNKYPQCMGY